MMLAGVICDTENFKVLQSIVMLDFVLVAVDRIAADALERIGHILRRDNQHTAAAVRRNGP